MNSCIIVQIPRGKIAENPRKHKYFLPREFNTNSHSHPPKKLLEQLREAIRVKGYSIRAEKSYVAWVRRYIYFHIEAFLTYLAVDRDVVRNPVKTIRDRYPSESVIDIVRITHLRKVYGFLLHYFALISRNLSLRF